ncbi:LysR family transcriptional regulator [Devosia sp. 2618]|uniref:LysR family transcriptional regulator n=1 Tax=Devosia sp. 2618 TaxID=3156454 RepID=UPI00339178E3
MRISLGHLEAMVWIARLGSVSAAADHLNLTQSSVSLRLRDLSDALGRTLFVRQGRRMALTPDGSTTLAHAILVIEQVDKLYESARPQQIAGTLRMGVSEAIAMAGLPSIISKLAKAHPKLRLELAIGTSADLERDLLAGNADLALGINLYEDPRLKILPLGEQQSTWLACAGLPLPECVRPRDIGHLPVLTNPSPSPMYQQTVNWFRTERITPHHISVSNSVTVIAHMVAAGVGVAILPTRLVEKKITSGEVIALRSEPAIEASFLSAAYRADDWRPAINAALDVARAVIDDIHWLEPSRRLS